MTDSRPAAVPGAEQREVELIALEKAALAAPGEHGHDAARGGEHE